MSSLFLQVTKLIWAFWPIAQNSNDFVDPMLEEPHKKLAVVEMVKSIKSCV